MPDQLLTQPHGGPMLFFLDGVDRPERERLCRLVSEHGGRVVVNPARHPHCVTLSEGEPGSQRRPLFSDEEDAFSTRFLYDCVSAGRVVDLGPYRLQPVSLYVGPDRSQDVLRGLVSWDELVVAGTRSRWDDDDPRHRGLLKFTREQDEALVRFVGEQWQRRTGALPTGWLFWKLKAHLLPPCLAGHPPLSLQTRIKQVRPRLSEFKSSVPLRLLATAAAAAGVRLSLTDEERHQLERPPPAVQDREEPAPAASPASSHGSSRHTRAAGEERTDDCPASGAGPQSRPGTDGAGGTTADRPSSPVQSGSGDSACEMGDSDWTAELPPWQRRRLVRRPAERHRSQPARREASNPARPRRASRSLSPAVVSPTPPGPADAGASGPVRLQTFRRRSTADRNSTESQSGAGPSAEPEPGSARRPHVSGRTMPRRRRRRVVSRKFVSDSEEESSPPPAPERRRSPPAAGSANRRPRPRRPSSSSSSDVSSSVAAADRGSPAPSDSGPEGGDSGTESAGSSSSSEAEHPAAPDPGRDGPTRRRRLYTRQEDIAILQFLEEAPRQIWQVNGRLLWQLMAGQVEGRTWQSLKERFVKRISPNLSSYEEVSPHFRRDLYRWLHKSAISED